MKEKHESISFVLKKEKCFRNDDYELHNTANAIRCGIITMFAGFLTVRSGRHTGEELMYIHIGGEHSISDKFIIGMFDLNNVLPQQSDMLHFLEKGESEGRIEYLGTDLPQTLIVTLDRLYISPLSTRALINRTTRTCL